MPRPHRLSLRGTFAVAVLVAFACGEPTRVVGPEGGAAMQGRSADKKKNGTVTVGDVDPSFGRRGQTLLGVRISGSGFDNTAVATWERDGVPVPGITVRATRYLNSSTLEADIEIDDDTELGLYDVAVTLSAASGGKRGVGAERFEVTTAIAMGTICTTSYSAARGANVLGQAVGHSCSRAFYWEEGAPLVDLGEGVANDIDEAGHAIVGAAWSSATSTSDGPAVIWRRVGSGWSRSDLPSEGRTARANAIASDESGHAMIIAGQVIEQAKRNTKVVHPTLWFREGTTWHRVALPRPAGVTANASLRVRGVNASGIAAGGYGGIAVVWERNVNGQYVGTRLPGTGMATGVATDGSIVVGDAGGAAYWRRTGTGWSEPIPLSSCSGGWVNAINASHLIVGRGCSGAGAWQLDPVTGSVYEMRLPGLGGTEAGEAWGVGNGTPARVVGNAPPRGTGANPLAVYWDVY